MADLMAELNTKGRRWRMHDIAFSEDEKILELNNLIAEAVFHRAIDLCRRNSTAGAFTYLQIHRDVFTAASEHDLKAALTDLIRVGLITQSDNSYTVSSFANWNPSNEYWHKQEAIRQARSVMGNHKRWCCGEGVLKESLRSPYGSLRTIKDDCVGCEVHQNDHDSDLNGCPKCSGPTFFNELVEHIMTRVSPGQSLFVLKDSLRTPNGILKESQNKTKLNKTKQNKTVVETKSEPKRSSKKQVTTDVATTHEADQLCQQLAEAIANHRTNKQNPAITKGWAKTMDLLLRRGQNGIAKPQPIPAQDVAAMIEAVFTQLAQPAGTGGFCWADQIESPTALRKHWNKIEQALNTHKTSQPNHDAALAIAKAAGAQFTQ